MTDEPNADEAPGRTLSQRRRGGDDEPVLPSRAEAEREEAWGDRPRSAERDEDWYREQRPPHHGG